MTFLYFGYDSVIGDDEADKMLLLIETATALNCNLYQVSAIDRTRKEPNEGYVTNHYAIRVPSQAVFDEFVGRIAGQTGFTNWYLMSEADYEEILSHPLLGRPLPSLQESMRYRHFFAALEGLQGIAEYNRQLEELLRTQEALYFACECILPPELPADWLDNILAISLGLGLGREMRLGKTKQTAEGFYAQELVIRVFSEEELQRYIQRIGDPLGLSAWSAVSKQEFLDADAVTPYGLVSHQYQAELAKMSQANAELRRKMT